MLTTREKEVLILLSKGYTYKAVAEALGVSPGTITSHIKNTYRKLAVRNGAGAVMRAVELRLLSAWAYLETNLDVLNLMEAAAVLS